MSVNWSWKHKMGEVVIAQMHQNEVIKFKMNIYEANCLCAVIYEFENEEGKKQYQFYSFFSDLEHLKRCLKDGILTNGADKWLKVKLNTFYKDSLKIAKELSKAKIKVELYYKEPKERKGAK